VNRSDERHLAEIERRLATAAASGGWPWTTAATVHAEADMWWLINRLRDFESALTEIVNKKETS
jgi:hypothetical protein